LFGFITPTLRFEHAGTDFAGVTFRKSWTSAESLKSILCEFCLTSKDEPFWGLFRVAILIPVPIARPGEQERVADGRRNGLIA
jgi:hypothetical protein